MPPAYEKGRYKFKVSFQGFGESKEKQTPYFFLEGIPTTLLGEDGEEFDPGANYKREIRMYVTEKTIDRVRADLTKLGWPDGRLSNLDPATPNFHSLIGDEIEVECKYEPSIKNDGTLIEKWDLPYDGAGEPATSKAGVASKLDAMFGSSAPAKKPPGRKPPVKETAGAGAYQERTTAPGDDIPF